MHGSFFLNLAITLGGANQPIGVIATLTLLVAIGAPISGAHFNPSITFGLHMSGDQKTPIVKYMAVAIGAAIGAHAFAYLLTGIAPTALATATNGIGWYKIVAGELLGTFAAATVVMWVVLFSEETSHVTRAFCIGLGFLASIITFSGLSGC